MSYDATAVDGARTALYPLATGGLGKLGMEE